MRGLRVRVEEDGAVLLLHSSHCMFQAYFSDESSISDFTNPFRYRQVRQKRYFYVDSDLGDWNCLSGFDFSYYIL